jgi:hypothetical protein
MEVLARALGPVAVAAVLEADAVAVGTKKSAISL